MFIYFGTLLTLGVFLGYVVFLPWPWWARVSLTALVFLLATRIAILRYIFGGLGGMEAPKWLLMVTSFFQGLLVILFILALFRFLAWGLIVILSHTPVGTSNLLAFFKSSLWLPKASLALTLAAALLSGLSLGQAAKVPALRHHEVFFPAWPKALDGLTVAILADAHISRFFDRPWVAAVVAATMAEKPDLILLPGDLVDGSVNHRLEDVAPLAQLKAPYGVFACVGNHEYYSGLNQWLAALEKLGITVLSNRHEVIFPNGVPLVIAGVTDLTALDRRFSLPGPDLDKAMAGAPTDPPVILLEHRPGQARSRAKNQRIVWMISGHTHGGMLPVLKAVVKKVNNGFVSGWYEVERMKLFVHPGLGLWNGFPMRLFNPSEISLVTIRAAQSRFD
jgi:predicted MPP superfamily phosphohydrolase